MRERRQYQRFSPDTPLVVLMDKCKYALMFDFSAGGVALEGLVPRNLGENIFLEFNLPEGNGCIQGRGQIVWTNEAEHRTGVHFLDLAANSEEHLSEWLSTRTYTSQLAEVSHRILASQETDTSTNSIFQGNGEPRETWTITSQLPLISHEELKSGDWPLQIRATAANQSESRPTLWVALALVAVFLFTAAGFWSYHQHGMQNQFPVKDKAAATESSEPPPLAASAPVVPAAPTNSFAPAPGGLETNGYVLQVGAMAIESNADSLAETLQQSKFPGFVFKRRDDRLYKVAVGPYSDENAAQAAKSELEKRGFKAILTPWMPD